MYAAGSGHLEACELLVERGSMVNLRRDSLHPDGNTCRATAAANLLPVFVAISVYKLRLTSFIFCPRAGMPTTQLHCTMQHRMDMMTFACRMPTLPLISSVVYNRA